MDQTKLTLDGQLTHSCKPQRTTPTVEHEAEAARWLAEAREDADRGNLMDALEIADPP